VADTITKKTVAEHAKELLADARHRIVLDDFVNEHLRAALEALSPKHFPVSAGGTNEDLVKRISAYESAVRKTGTLVDAVLSLAHSYWLATILSSSNIVRISGDGAMHIVRNVLSNPGQPVRSQ
jgi:hypothetical protein